MHREFQWAVAAIGILIGVAGCGGGLDFEVAAVSGQVTCNDKPVPGGQLQFVPVNDSGADEVPPTSFALIDENGNFSIAEVVVGSHTVSFIRPELDEDQLEEMENTEVDDQLDAQEEKNLVEKFKSIPCQRVADPDVTIAAGENKLDIELGGAAGGRRRGGDDDED